MDTWVVTVLRQSLILQRQNGIILDIQCFQAYSILLAMHPQLNWIEHMTTDHEVRGSNPLGCAIQLKASGVLRILYRNSYAIHMLFQACRQHILVWQYHSTKNPLFKFSSFYKLHSFSHLTPLTPYFQCSTRLISGMG